MPGTLVRLAHLAAAVVLTCVLPLTTSADTIRVVAQSANVRLNANETSPVMLSLTAGTVLDNATAEGQWFAVTLPPDANGFRRVGYVSAKVVEVLRAAGPAAAAPAPASLAPVAAAAPASAIAAPPTTASASRDTVAVMDFEYGTIQRWWAGTWDVGKGIADIMVDELVNSNAVRVIERKKLLEILSEQEFSNSDRADVSAAAAAKIGKMLGARYLIYGSITQFSYEEGGIGGLGRLPVVGGVAVKTGKANVGISARMIETSTGEIIASGVAKESASRRNVAGVGGAGGYGGAIAMTSSQYLDTVLGEATQAAIRSTTAKLLTSKARAGGQ